jgi:hypothetical protein
MYLKILLELLLRAWRNQWIMRMEGSLQTRMRKWTKIRDLTSHACCQSLSKAGSRVWPSWKFFTLLQPAWVVLYMYTLCSHWPIPRFLWGADYFYFFITSFNTAWSAAPQVTGYTVSEDRTLSSPRSILSVSGFIATRKATKFLYDPPTPTPRLTHRVTLTDQSTSVCSCVRKSPYYHGNKRPGKKIFFLRGKQKCFVSFFSVEINYFSRSSPIQCNPVTVNDILYKWETRAKRCPRIRFTVFLHFLF